MTRAVGVSGLLGSQYPIQRPDVTTDIHKTIESAAASLARPGITGLRSNSETLR